MTKRCPACYSENNNLFLNVIDHKKRNSFNLYECQKCGLVFLYPLPSKEKLSRYYDDDYYQLPEKGIVGFLEENLKNAVFAKHFNHIENYVKKGTLLDVGCGNGYFLNFAKKKGWKTLGIEFSSYASKFAERYGLKVIKKPVENVKLSKEQFDAITFFNVLEHTSNPNNVLKKTRDWLKKKGILLIEVPDLDSLQSSVFKQNWFHLDVPRHLLHFRRISFKRLIESNGFKIIDEYSIPFSLHEIAGWLIGLNLMLKKNKKSKKGMRRRSSRKNSLKLFTLLVFANLFRIIPNFLFFRPAIKTYILRKI